MFKYVLAALLAIASPGFSAAAVIGNGPPNDSGGSDMNGYLEADKFTLGTSSFLTSLTYWSLQNGAADYTGTTVVDIFADGGSTPGALLYSFNQAFNSVSGGASSTGLTIFVNTAGLSVPLLAAGNYWIGLHNGPTTSTNASSTYYWDWSADSGVSRSMDLSVANSPWVENDASLAFSLTTRAATTVPEPAELALIALGIVAGGWARRRKTSEARRLS